MASNNNIANEVVDPMTDAVNLETMQGPTIVTLSHLTSLEPKFLLNSYTKSMEKMYMYTYKEIQDCLGGVDLPDLNSLQSSLCNDARAHFSPFIPWSI